MMSANWRENTQQPSEMAAGWPLCLYFKASAGEGQLGLVACVALQRSTRNQTSLSVHSSLHQVKSGFMPAGMRLGERDLFQYIHETGEPTQSIPPTAVMNQRPKLSADSLRK